MNSPAMAVLVDGLFFDEARKIWEGILPVHAWPEDIEEGGTRLEALFDEDHEAFIVHGDDELLGKVVTAYWRRSNLGGKPLSLWPLRVGEGMVSSWLTGTMEPRKAAKLIKKGSIRWHRQPLGTLKVTASTNRGAWYGFSFGAGWVYRAFEARKRAQGSAGNFVTAWSRLATDTWRDDDGRSLALRTAVDHQATNSGAGSMVATTLGKTYFGLGSGEARCVLWSHLTTSDLVKRALTPEVLDRSRGGQAFESLHLDTPEGWILDGRLHAAGEPGVVQVTSGPSVTVFHPAAGLGARVGSWLRER